MELRSYNVKAVYSDCVKCRINNELGVHRNVLADSYFDVLDMCKQLPEEATLKEMNVRKDGEVWTPYLQVVEMLILLGAKIGVIKFEGLLTPDTIIKNGAV